MSKKKKVFLAILILIVLFFAFNLITWLRTGKQEIKLVTNSKYYAGSSLNAMIEVNKRKNYSSIPTKANVKVELLDKNEKKVKGTKKVSVKLEENTPKSINMEIPDNISEGEYYLKITSKAGLLKETIKSPINISGSRNSDAIISLDKGIYKPGDEVNFRALIVSKKDDLPVENDVSVSIYDGNDNRVFFEKTKTSEYGITSGKFELADEVNSGTYRLVVTNGSKDFTKSFIVNPYVTPKFEAKVSSDKETYIIGEKASITVEAKYFFGEPVKEANVNLKINDEEIKGITNAEGKFTTEYEVKDAGRKDFSAEVIDSSNYLIEAQKTIYGATDKFEIELIPEYGSLINGIDNNIYLVTKKASGEPIKTVNKISIGGIKRDVITDESGMKSFTLTSADISKINADSFIVSSTDSEGTVINKEFSVKISNSTDIIVTDKYKYNENDDINISILGGTEWSNKDLYVCKGDELIETVTLDSNETSINLGETTGLIDIFVKSTNSYRNNNKKYFYGESSNYEPNGYIRKTIFIKPSKNLTVDISTNSEQYSPKDKLNISFKTTNENGNPVDSALLVSILDEAVLNLADNDLSIDNIKLALEDIELSDGVTAADLYAEVLDESSSMKLQTLLLKQNSSNIGISGKVFDNNTERYQNLRNAIISGIALLIIFTVLLIKKTSKGKSTLGNAIVGLIIVSFVTVAIIFGTFSIIEALDLENIFYLYAICVFIIITILYFTNLNKYSGYLAKLILTLTICPLIWGVLIEFICEITDEEVAIYMILILAVISWIILTIAKKGDNLGKKADIVRRFLGISLKGVLFWWITIYLIETTEVTFAFLVTLTIYILLDVYIFKGGNSKNKEKIIQDGKIVINATTLIMAILIALAIIILFAIGLFIYTSSQSTINDSMTNGSAVDYSYDSSIRDNYSGYSLGDAKSFSQYEDAADETGTAGIGSGIFGDISDSISDIFEGSTNDSMTQKATSEDLVMEDTQDIATAQLDTKKENKEVEKVRNVFLESLAFIPEVVTENGSKDITLDISDNITTWNIQAIGNTKDGRLGSSSKTFKVFKEFFVDFSLPTNSVIGDYVEIPVTIYNYTENDLAVELNVKEVDWAKIGEYGKTVNVPAKATNMVYVPLEILKNGQNTLRVESAASGVTDIVEKTMTVNYNGLEKTIVETSGSIEKDFTQDIIFNETAIEGSKKIKVKLYPTSATEIINGMENVLKMPSGCFEQTSSSLYPDILAIKYLEENNLSSPEIKEKAMEYISKGYQKLLTYEVPGEKGGYSLYGNAPAEPVITAFGLMEFKELSGVYEVDQKVIDNMKEYLYKNQKISGDFDYSSTYIGTSASTDKYAMNAYIIWALSEADPDDKRIEKSVSYLEKNLDNVTDNYTLALIANVFANTSNKKANDVIDRLSKNLTKDNNYTYVKSSIKDYYGTSGKYQNIQATALTSIALSKLSRDAKANEELINYIIGQKDSRGTWGTTQSTILALKAINDYNKKGKLKEQTITVEINGNEQKAEIKEDSLDIYEFIFDNVSDENTVKIGMKDGSINYEVVKEYYQSYDLAHKIGIDGSRIMSDVFVKQELNTSLNINDIITQNIHIINNGESIENALAQINIPQGCTVDEDSLLEMKYNQIIEKYEYNYGKINIYLREFTKSESIDLQVKYRATYPERITGAAIRVYDYYNPENEGIADPVGITVNK